ncbi:hypothetical protein EJ08DRAFT_107036 [Tothia fuscella]|uniref:Uncharacterized protein n=1 Tax=Tothia fuscella TaxID=1048955 RepID=A0A9P4NDW3_9PEZI|nr:hypothetical protein EJ08DRAFT_107036 [Tothia fuscella]
MYRFRFCVAGCGPVHAAVNPSTSPVQLGSSTLNLDVPRAQLATPSSSRWSSEMGRTSSNAQFSSHPPPVPHNQENPQYSRTLNPSESFAAIPWGRAEGTAAKPWSRYLPQQQLFLIFPNQPVLAEGSAANPPVENKQVTLPGYSPQTLPSSKYS